MLDEFCSLGRKVYFESRRRGAGHIQALRVIGPMLEQHQRTRQSDAAHGVQGAVLAVLPEQGEIEGWATEQAWDLQFEQLQSDDFRNNLRAPEDEEDRYRLRLEAAQRQREHAEDMLRSVQAESDAASFTMSDAYLTRLSSASRLFDAACRTETRLEDEARKRLLEMPAGPAAIAEIESRTQKLLREYGDLGPHYEILCKQLAGLDYQRDMQMRSGRDIPTEEVVKLNDGIIRTIGQLQKYTESSKSETLSKDRDQLALALLDIGEKIFATQAPAAWSAYILAIKRRLQTTEPQAASILNRGEFPNSVLSLVPRDDGTFMRGDESG